MTYLKLIGRQSGDVAYLAPDSIDLIVPIHGGCAVGNMHGQIDVCHTPETVMSGIEQAFDQDPGIGVLIVELDPITEDNPEENTDEPGSN